MNHFNEYLKMFRKYFLVINKFNSEYDNPTLNDDNLVVGFNTKILKHLTTSIIIIENENTGLQSLDLHAVNVLIRTIYENIVTFNYVFDSNLSSEESEFRMLIWKFSSISQSFNQNKNVINPSEKYDLLTNLLTQNQRKFLNDLKNNKIFSTLKKDHQDNILKGYWRYKKGFVSLGNWMGLRNEYLNYVYNKLSSSVHNDYNSISMSFAFPIMEEVIRMDLIYSLNFLIFILFKYYEILRLHYKNKFPDFFEKYFDNDLDKDVELINFFVACRSMEESLKKN